MFPDLAPANTVRPYCTYQQVGGEAINYTDGAIPSIKNARMQVNVWGDTRSQVAPLARQVEDTLRGVLQTTVLGAAIGVYEPETGLRGSMQDFSMWSA